VFSSAASDACSTVNVELQRLMLLLFLAPLKAGAACCCCCRSSSALSLLKALLARDPKQRLGSGANGADAVKKHAFFKKINWAKLEARQVESKFKPGVKCNLVSQQ
jgi:hypothetical protein